MADKNTFRLKELLRERKMTVKELASKVDKSYVYVSTAFAGSRNASLGLMEDVANVLGVSVRDLFRPSPDEVTTIIEKEYHKCPHCGGEIYVEVNLKKKGEV